VSDPFEDGCVWSYRERATIGRARGWYGAGPDEPPHLCWRAERPLYTVSGPFPKRDLLAIARSLAPSGAGSPRARARRSVARDA
jgi:hypothetical protein